MPDALPAAGRIHAWRDAVMDSKLSSGEKIVAMAVTRFADRGSCETSTGSRRLASLASISERSARTHVLALIELGWLEITGTKGSARDSRTRILRLRIPVAATIAATGYTQPATIAATQHRHAANGDTTCGKSLHGHAATVAYNPLRDPLRDPVPDSAEAAWEKLLSTQGKDRTTKVQSALDAIGGWTQIRDRTSFNSTQVRRNFIEAYKGRAE